MKMISYKFVVISAFTVKPINPFGEFGNNVLTINTVHYDGGPKNNKCAINFLDFDSDLKIR